MVHEPFDLLSLIIIYYKWYRGLYQLICITAGQWYPTGHAWPRTHVVLPAPRTTRPDSGRDENWARVL